jgi:hypothetical protein
VTVERKTGRWIRDPRRVLWPLALSLAVLLFVGGPGYRSPRSIAAAWDLGHVVAFALWSYLLVSWRPVAETSVPGQWGIVLAFCLVAGSATEGIQWVIGGDVSAADFFRDVVGGLITLSWLAPSARKLRGGARWAARGLAAILLILASIPLATALSDEAIARHQFPTLSDFETPLETNRWEGDARYTVSRAVARRGKASLCVEMGTALYSGVSLVYFPGDWRGYRFLTMDVQNPSQEEIVVTCRVHDRLHEAGEQRHEDRFNRTFRLSPGWSEIRIDLGEVARAPAGREMDLGRIRAVMLFAKNLPQRRTIYLDSVRLE